METIICAAIHYDNHIKYHHQQIYGINTGFVLAGYRHPNIIGILPTNIYFEKLNEYSDQLAIKWSKGLLDHDGKPLLNAKDGKTYQGFITSKGRFVNRKEAAKIALESGQIDKLHYSDTELYSEDLY